MKSEKIVVAFFELVRAGLWGESVQGSRFNVDSVELNLHGFESLDCGEVYRLAEEQSVIGLVAAGIDYLKVNDSRFTIPQEWTLQFVGSTLQLEQRNKAMNAFIGKIIGELRKADVYTLLVKGQGVAQCYEKPLWRACGDVDLLLTRENYEKAKRYLMPQASHVEEEDERRLHLGMTIDGWVVELHGTTYTKLSRRMNRVADEVHGDLFFSGNVRSWVDNGVQVFLPSADNDVIIIFNHIINHFFLEGVGLRQICDWCRLLFCYREKLDLRLLESRIKKEGLMTEWKAFYNLASRYLGLPDLGEGMMACDSRFDRKADRIMAFVLESGNFGHNRDVSYRAKNPAHIVNAITLWRRICDFTRFARIFPLNSPRFFLTYVMGRVWANL